VIWPSWSSGVGPWRCRPKQPTQSTNPTPAQAALSPAHRLAFLVNKEVRPMATQSAEQKEEGQPYRGLRGLQIATTVSVVLLLLIVLVPLGLIGYRETIAEVNPQITATPTPTGTITATQTVTPTVTTTPAATETITATTAATLTLTAPAATFAAGQHFVTLAVLTATLVLFPWVLLLAFAFQRAPRLYRELAKDLEKLGLSGNPEKIRQDLEKDLTKTIQEGVKIPEREEPPDRAQYDIMKAERASEYAKSLVSMNLGYGTGPGTPPDVETSVWQAAVQQGFQQTEEVSPKFKPI